ASGWPGSSPACGVVRAAAAARSAGHQSVCCPLVFPLGWFQAISTWARVRSRRCSGTSASAARRSSLLCMARIWRAYWRGQPVALCDITRVRLGLRQRSVDAELLGQPGDAGAGDPCGARVLHAGFRVVEAVLAGDQKRLVPVGVGGQVVATQQALGAHLRHQLAMAEAQALGSELERKAHDWAPPRLLR